MGDLPKWERRAREDAPVLENTVREAGPDGLTRQQLIELSRMGKERFENAVKRLSQSPAVETTYEERLNRRGQPQDQLVFRHRDAQPMGTAPARVSRDPAVRGVLNEFGLIEAVAKAKERGLRKPRPIARWILKQPLCDPSRWVDVEGLLAEKIEELERSQFESKN